MRCGRCKNRNIKLIILGFSGSGKTSLLNYIIHGKLTKTSPTLGFTQKKFQYRKYTIHVFDVSGSPAFTSLWSNYYSEVCGIILMIDSTKDILENKRILMQLLLNEYLMHKPFLIFSNKQDVSKLSGFNICSLLDIINLSQECSTPIYFDAISLIPSHGNSNDLFPINLNPFSPFTTQGGSKKFIETYTAKNKIGSANNVVFPTHPVPITPFSLNPIENEDTLSAKQKTLSIDTIVRRKHDVPFVNYHNRIMTGINWLISMCISQQKESKL